MVACQSNDVLTIASLKTVEDGGVVFVEQFHTIAIREGDHTQTIDMGLAFRDGLERKFAIRRQAQESVEFIVEHVKPFRVAAHRRLLLLSQIAFESNLPIVKNIASALNHFDFDGRSHKARVEQI